jgi:formylglycine-generating enzyme required for sulfatase activity
MRLFITYARVDTNYCSQIVDVLDVHDIWFDTRLHAGQHWWDQIQRRLEWCEGFLYLLSPDSVASAYCRREYEVARSLGKFILPVLIDDSTAIPADLSQIQYVNMTGGMTPEVVKSLLTALYLAERHLSRRPSHALVPASATGPLALLDSPAAAQDVEAIISEAAAAFDRDEYDRAVFLLRQARDSGYQSPYIDLEAMLNEAEEALEAEAYRRDAEREYVPIAALVRTEQTRKIGLQALRAFHRMYPDYDPQNLAAACLNDNMPLLEWCAVPAGEVKIVRGIKTRSCLVEAFEIGKYPVTNGQFAEFVNAPDGYACEDWWDFSIYALRWRREHPQAVQPRLVGPDHPCVSVCWYEAVAFSRWLSERMGMNLSLPTEQQWQRAAQGDDGRMYPWGDTFEQNRCNTRESRIGLTVPVTYYTRGVSPYGVFDMAGNVWEWCLNPEDSGQDARVFSDENRIVKGGSHIGIYKRAQCRFYYLLNPQCRYNSIGFRLVLLRD